MIRAAIMVVLAVAGTAVAGPREWKLDVPTGWTEITNPQIETMAAKLRGVQATVDVGGTTYVAPDQKTQLTLLQWSVRVGASAHALEELNRGLIEGMSKQLTTHVSDDAHFEGQQLVADQIDEANSAHVHQHRRFAIDADGVTHVVWASCAGTKSDACERAIMGLQLMVAGQVAPDAGSHSETSAYRIGQITGVVVVLLLVGLWLKTGGHVWRRPKKS